MPIDFFGNRAEVVIDAEGTLRRTNFGRFNEHYINATTVYVEKVIKEMVDQGRVKEATDYLFNYYRCVSPKMYEYAMSIYKAEKQREQHTLEVVKSFIQLWIPTDSPNTGSECIKALMDNFPLPSSPVVYRGVDGKKCITVKDIIIGSMYTISLEKIGDDWGATSIPKRQHHGIPGKLTDGDKSSLPWRDQPFKITGESEIRLLNGVLEPPFVSMLVNFPNSPAMCMEAAETILTAPKPTNIPALMNYRHHVEIPGRSLQYFNHILNVSGIEIVPGGNYDN